MLLNFGVVIFFFGVKLYIIIPKNKKIFGETTRKVPRDSQAPQVIPVDSYFLISLYYTLPYHLIMRICVRIIRIVAEIYESARCCQFSHLNRPITSEFFNFFHH